ncbi:hypothetical protein MMC07_007095 [Pseudocyphellaria aurata]|nr:hypothetical protein [Pseudocyphellaria aurata]
MSSSKRTFVLDESEDQTLWPPNDRKQTSIDKTTIEVRSSPQIAAEKIRRKRKSPSHAQGKKSNPSTQSVRKNITPSTSRRSSIAQSKASARSPTKPSGKTPRAIRFDRSRKGLQENEKQAVTAVEEEDNPDESRGLEVLPDPTPSILTQRDLEQWLPPQPLLPRTDADFEVRYGELKAAVMKWVEEHFSKDFEKPPTALDLLQISKKAPELIQYINFIASSGNDSWEQIFVERRIALVYGVLGKAIEIHVFGEEMFGASDMQRTTLRRIDLEMLNLNGFVRQKVRAGTINAFLSAHPRALPPEFVSSLALLQARVSALLSPLLSSAPVPRYHHDLSSILVLAAKLSLDMRREPATIYYVTPIASDNEFQPRNTDIINSQQLAEAEPRRAHHEQPVVRVAVWPSVHAYRPGSGREGGEEDGFRTRRISKSEAYVQWGSLIPFSMRAGSKTTYPHNSEPNTSLRTFLTQQQQQQQRLEAPHHEGDDLPIADSSSSSASSAEKASTPSPQKQIEMANQRTPSTVDRRLLMTRAAAAAAGGIGVVGAVLAATTYGGEAAEIVRGLVGG